MFDPDRILTTYVLREHPLPTVPPNLNDVVRCVAMIDGFLARKSNGEPRVKIIWIGLQRLLGFPAGVRFSGRWGQWSELNRQRQ